MRGEKPARLTLQQRDEVKNGKHGPHEPPNYTRHPPPDT